MIYAVAIFFDPKIPGDKEKKAAEMKKEYKETMDDLIRKGMFDFQPVPGDNSH